MILVGGEGERGERREKREERDSETYLYLLDYKSSK